MTEINHFVKTCAYRSFSTSKLYWYIYVCCRQLLGAGTSLMCHCTDRFLYNFTLEIGVSLMITINGENKTKLKPISLTVTNSVKMMGIWQTPRTQCISTISETRANINVVWLMGNHFTLFYIWFHRTVTFKLWSTQ